MVISILISIYLYIFLIESVVDLISKMKEIMSATESAATTRENVRDIVRQKLPDLMRKVVQETQNAHEIYLAEKQLLSYALNFIIISNIFIIDL